MLSLYVSSYRTATKLLNKMQCQSLGEVIFFRGMTKAKRQHAGQVSIIYE